MNGWLSPEGRFYECHVSKHLTEASRLFLAVNPERALERLRWIKVTPPPSFYWRD